jgi:hypothetical protein
VSDTIEVLKRRISHQIKASGDRCLAAQELLQQTADLVTMSRDAIARSRDEVACLELKTAASAISCRYQGARRPLLASPVSMSIHEEATRAAVTPLMGASTTLCFPTSTFRRIAQFLGVTLAMDCSGERLTEQSGPRSDRGKRARRPTFMPIYRGKHKSSP